MCVKLSDNQIVVQLQDETCRIQFHDLDANYLEDADANFDTSSIDNTENKYAFQCQNEQLQFITFDNAPGVAYRRIVKANDEELAIACLHEVVRFADDSELNISTDTFCFHAENTRIYERFCMGATCDRTGAVDNSFNTDEVISGTHWAGEGNLRKEVGCSPFQPFPVMIWGNRRHNRIFLDGTLSQKRLYRYYETNDDGFHCFQAPKTVKKLIVPAGEQLIGEWNYLEVAESEDLNHPYAGFVAALENVGGDYSGSKQGSHSDMIWGSWNDGIFRDIDQKRILENADFITTHFPTVKWVQIDDGYDEWDYDQSSDRIGIGVAAPGESFSYTKFPDGPRRFTDEIRRRGLRPALWVGLAVAAARRPFTTHPEWFIDYFQVPKFRYLDISRADAREFVRKAFRTFFEEWGFEGIKLDFWSYFFEDEQIELANGTMTGGEYREWFLKTCREFMPEDGYLQTGCDIAMGNTHLAEYADNYRYGIDIGHGEWSNVRTNAKWAAFCLNTHTGHLFVPNSDSIGYFPGLQRDEAQTAINFCLITRTLLEVAGWLYQDPDNPLLPFLQKACCCPKNGEDVFFGNYNFKETDDAPAVWYLKTAHFSLDEENELLPERTVAVFNWSDQQESIEVSAGALGLDSTQCYLLKDFWSSELLSIPAGDALVLPLEGHCSRLFSVVADNKNCIADSNMQINGIRLVNGMLSMEAPHGDTPELALTFRPDEVCVNGQLLNTDNYSILV